MEILWIVASGLAVLGLWLVGKHAPEPPVVIPGKPTPNEDAPRPPDYRPNPRPLPPEQSEPQPTPNPEPIPDPADPVQEKIPDANGDYPKGYRVPWERVRRFLTAVGLPFDTEHGPLTIRSIKQCQTATTWFSLVPDGVPGPKTAKDWDQWEAHGFRVARTFSLREFFCRCVEYERPGKPRGVRYADCEVVWVSRDAIVHAQRTRDQVFKGPVTPKSAYRDPTHNADQKGAANSRHLGREGAPALAVDFPRTHVLDEYRPIGWHMLGLYGGKVGHCDMRPGAENRTYIGTG